MPPGSMTNVHLALLLAGQVGIISEISTEPALHQRLSALGFRVGQQVTVLRRAWLSGPLHIRIGTTEVMVRCRDAKAVGITFEGS
jgi:ferrous iron transport protein A